jgi:membrane associated rhomboid family serine protease
MKKDKRVWPHNPWQAAFMVGGFTALLYVIELIATIIPADLNQMFGIWGRTLSGADGILLAPLLHLGWWHLNGNAPLVLVLGFLVMAGGLRQGIAITATVWLISGTGVWLINPDNTYTVGVSGVTMGWLVYLLTRGILTRSLPQISIAVVLFLYWGATLRLIFPSHSIISWQGHLFGALGGLVALWLVAEANWRTRSALPSLNAAQL